MNELARPVADVLLALEAELRRLDLWEAHAPIAADLQSVQPFCCDTLSLPQWLQWILLPRMRAAVSAGGPYPPRSGIHAYAEEWVRYQPGEYPELLRLIKRFDDLIEAQPPAP